MTGTPHILGDEWLVDYAAGTAPGPVAVFIAAHLALSPAARKAYACLEAVGGSLLQAIEPAALNPGALEAVLQRLDAPSARPADLPAKPDAAIVPDTLRSHLPGGLAGVRWRSLARGIDQYLIPCRDARGFRLSLMRVASGRTIPRHTHRGDELVLVLDGGYQDAFGHYGRGEVEVADPTIDHHP